MFSKYNSIINHFSIKMIDDLIKRNLHKLPNIITFEVTEKIHGANFSFLAENGEVKYCSRVRELEVDEYFYGYQKVVSETKYSSLKEELLLLSNRYNASVQLIGELFGSNIQKGVFYGNEKQFKWYAMKINGELIPTAKLDVLLKDFMDLKVPVLGFVQYDVSESLEKFINSIHCELESQLTPEKFEESNICEGVVCVPYYIIPLFGCNYLAIKKKNDAFKDKKSAKRIVAEISKEEDIPQEAKNLSNELCSYINEIRTSDLFSKFGEISKVEDLRNYANLYLKDVMNDFLLENREEFDKLPKVYRKWAVKIPNSKIYEELKKYL